MKMEFRWIFLLFLGVVAVSLLGVSSVVFGASGADLGLTGEPPETTADVQTPSDKSTQWRSARQNPALTGSNPAASGPATDVGPAWIVRTDATWGGPVVDGGVLYTGNRHGELYALDVETGTQEWRITLDEDAGQSPWGGIQQSPAVTDERVIAAVTNWHIGTTVVAVDRETGDPVWEYELDFVSDDPPIVAPDGTVVVSGSKDDGERVIIGIDPTPDEGEWPEQWRITYEGGVGFPVVTDDMVYALGGERRTEEDPTTLFAFERDTGETQWTQSIDGSAWHLLLGDGALYTHTNERIVDVDPDTGEIRAEYDVDVHYNTPMAYDEGMLYYATGSGWDEPAGVAAFDTETEAVSWAEWSIYEPRSPPTVGEKHVYISDDESIFAIERTEGTLAWEYRPGDPYGPTDTELVVVDDTLYVTHMSRTTQALVEGGEATEGGLVDLIRWVRDNAELGMTLFGAIGGLIGGLVAAGVTWGVIRLANYSRLPPQIFAGKLLRRPPAEISGRATVLAHVGAGVVLSIVFGALFIGVQLLLPQLLSPIAGIAVPLLLGLLVVAPIVFALLAVAGPWSIISYRWLPVNADVLDRDIREIRREWAIVHVVFAAVAVPIYGVVTFLLGMIVFFV